MVKKGRRLTIFGLLVAALVWLGARGLEDDPAQTEVSPLHTEPLDGQRPDAVTAAAPLVESATNPALADLFWGELRRMEAAITRGDARAALARRKRAEEMLRGIPDRDPLHGQFARACKRLGEFVAERLTQAEAELSIGRVLAAAAQLKPFAIGDKPLPGEFLDALDARGLDLVVTRISSVELPAMPNPLSSGRQVRVYHEGRLELGQVLRSTGDSVTVKLRSDSGMLYPELPGFQLGLVDPGMEEALDQSLRALHGGDSLLAGLWLTLASDRGAGHSRRAAEISRCLGR